jgi:uncharacterized protein
MILLDANLLIYAHVSTFAEHEAARGWLDERLNGHVQVGLPWPTLLSFLRIVTNPRVFEKPESMADARAQVAAWLEAEPAWIPQPSDRHRTVLERYLSLPGMRADLVPDAHLAALAVEHGLVLCSTDGDFARFPDLRWENPLASR